MVTRVNDGTDSQADLGRNGDRPIPLLNNCDASIKQNVFLGSKRKRKLFKV